MADLGTLWFGADVDLTKLKQSISQGNQSILDALKMSYDPKSYLDMVSDIKNKLASEKFEIKVTTNTQNLFNNNGGKSNYGNLDDLSRKILQQQNLVANLQNNVNQLYIAYQRLGGETQKSAWLDAKAALSRENAELVKLLNTRKAYNETTKQSTQTKKQASEAAKQLNSDHMRLNATLLGGIHVSTQLGSALSSLFAVDAARQFLHNVIEIGGQLEKQRISMGAIIGDTARANELFEQIKGMAIKSPFGVVELDQYSKQLAAYGIEQSKLFDMTKRLADISAGAGQDIGRLALALGHVKSATYLTGITLRQFSMNNIPMLKMLADYYSEVEKRAVSTAEVQKRISKREVSYEDVVEQIRRMTDEGGMFYNMQEKISESVAAKWKNLKDSLDIMYGDLAESKIGDMLKGTAEILMGLTTNWKTLLPVLGAAAGYFGVIKVSTLAMNTGLIVQQRLLTAQKMGWHENAMAASKYSVAQLRVIASMNTFNTGSAIMNRALLNLRIAFTGLVAGAKAAGAAIVAALPNVAILAGLSAMVGLWQKNREEIEKANSLADQLFERTQEGLKNVKAMMEETGMAFRDQYGNISGLFGKVPGKFEIPDVKSVDSATMAKNIEVWQEFIKNYSATPNLMLQAAYALDENGKATKSLAEQYEALGKSASDVAESLNLIGKYGEYLTESINESDGGWFDDNLLTDLKDYENEVRNYKRYAQDLYREHKKDAIAAVDAAMANADFAKAVEDAGIRSEDYASKLYKLSIESDKFKEASQAAYGVWRDLTGSSLASESLFQRGAFGAAERALDEEFGQVAERLKAKLESSGVDLTKLTEPERLALTQVFTDMATKAGVSVDEAKTKIWELVTTKFQGIKLDINDVEIAAKTSAMKEELNNLVDGDFHIDIKTATNAFDVIKSIREGYKSAKDAIENAKPILLKLGLEASGMATMTDEAIEKYAKGSEFVKSILTGVRDAQKQVNDALTASNNFGFSLSDPNKGGKTFKDSHNNTDKQLKQWKEQLKELENFYKVYKRNVEYMTKDDAIQKALSSGVFNIPKETIDNIDDYLKVLKDFRKKVEAEMGKNPSTERKSFLTDLLTKIDEKEFEVNIKKAADKAIKEIQEYISKKSEKFNLYKALLEKTGSKDFAKLAFEDGKIGDDLSKELAEKLKEAISSAGAEIDINTLWDKSDAEAQEMLKGVNGAYDLWKKIVDIIRGNYTEALNKGADAMANNLTATQKLQKLQKELVDLQEEYNKTADAARRKSLEAQIKAKKKEVDKQKIEVDNQDVETLQFYSAILSMTAEKAEVVGRKLRENLVEQLKAGTISGEEYVKAIKKIDQQIDTLREKKDFAAAFASGGFEAVRKLKLDIADDELTDASNRLKDANDKLREAIEKNTEAKTDEEKMESIKDVAEASAAVEEAEANHEVASQNQQAAEENYKSAKKFKTTVAAIAAAVQAMVQAFNDAKQAAAAYGEDLDANMSSFGQHYMGILEGLNTGLSRMQQGDFAGAISGVVFGSIASIAQKHDATLKQDIEYSQQILQRYDNMIEILEKRLDNTLGGVYAFKVGYEEINKLWAYLGKLSPELLKRYREGAATDEERNTVEKQWMSDIMLRGSVNPDGTGVGKKIGEEIAKDTYEAIMKAIESESYYDTKYAELLIQRDELKRQLADAEGMKDRDESQIEDYKQQLLELQEDIDNFAIDMAKALYDIDVQDWASKLTDAIVGAWESGEDAVEAYNKAVKDMMKDLTKNIIAKKILEQALKDANIDGIIQNLMKGSNGVLDENAVVELGDALMGAGQSAATATTALLDYLEAAGYIEKSAETTKTAFEDLRSTFLETLTDIESNAEDFKKNLEQIMIKDVIEKQILDVPFTINGMTFENFDAYLKNWNERYASAIKAGNQALIDALIDELVQAREITIKAAEELRERLKSVEEDTTFSDMSDSWVSNLMDMSKTAEDWAEEVGKTMAEKIIKEMIVPTLIQPYLNQLQQAWNDALPQYTTTDENGNKSYNWEGLLGDSAVRGAIKAITAAYPAASEAVKTVLEKLDIDISNYKYSGFSNLADSIIDSLKSADGSLESWAEDQGKKMAEQMAKAYIDQTYKNDIDALNKEWQEALEKGDTAAIDTVRKKLEALYARMGNDPELMKLIEDFKELDTTVTGLSDSFVSSLMDMSKSARDWGQELANTIAEAVIKMTVVPTLIKPLLQGVQDVFNSVVESATTIGENGDKVVDWKAIIGSTELADAINGVVEQYPQLKGIVEQILSAFGVDMYENPFSDMASEFTSSLMDMEQSAADFANSISRMLTEQMINKVITSQFQGEIDALGEMWREALEGGDVAAIEYIKQQLVELREKIGDAVQPLLDSISDIGKQADKTFSSMTDSWVSALMDMEGSAEDFAQEVGKTMVKEIITSMLAPKFLQPILDAMQQAFNLAINAPGATIQSVMQQMKPYLSQITSVYNEIFPMIQELFDGFGIVTKSVEEAAEEVEYALQDLKSNFVSSLMDMENSAEDFSKEISKILAQSFIEKFVLGDKFDAQMKYWQEQYESIIGSGMSEDERKKQLKALRDAIAAAKEGYVNNAMAIMDLLGLTTEDSQEATMNMADKITYDQADQLLGINLAQELTLEQILAFLKGKDMDFTPIYDSLVSNTASQDEHSRIITSTLQGNQIDYNPVLDSIASQTTAQDEHSRLIASTLQTILDVRSRGNDNILTQVAISNNHLYAISEYTKKMRDEVVMHLGSMDDKLTNLKRL